MQIPINYEYATEDLFFFFLNQEDLHKGIGKQEGTSTQLMKGYMTKLDVINSQCKTRSTGTRRCNHSYLNKTSM